jgi:hypothetical protein
MRAFKGSSAANKSTRKCKVLPMAAGGDSCQTLPTSDNVYHGFVSWVVQRNGCRDWRELSS